MTPGGRIRLGMKAWSRSLAYAVVAMLVAVAVLGVVLLASLRLLVGVLNTEDSTVRLVVLAFSFGAGMLASSAAVDLLFGRRASRTRQPTP